MLIASQFDVVACRDSRRQLHFLLRCATSIDAAFLRRHRASGEAFIGIALTAHGMCGAA